MEKKIYCLAVCTNRDGNMDMETVFSADLDALTARGQELMASFCQENCIPMKEDEDDEDFDGAHYESVRLGHQAVSYDYNRYYEIIIKLEEVNV